MSDANIVREEGKKNSIKTIKIKRQMDEIESANELKLKIGSQNEIN